MVAAVSLVEQQEQQYNFVDGMHRGQHSARGGLKIQIEAGNNACQHEGGYCQGDGVMQMYDNQPLPDKGGDELAADHTTQQHEQRHGTDKCMAFAVKKDALLAEMEAAGPLQAEKSSIKGEQDSQGLKKRMKAQNEFIYRYSPFTL